MVSVNVSPSASDTSVAKSITAEPFRANCTLKAEALGASLTGNTLIVSTATVVALAPLARSVAVTCTCKAKCPSNPVVASASGAKASNR
jgi:hypothetical protein